MRNHLRDAFFHWEFWIPPILAVVSIGVIAWLLNHNQDLLRQHQIDSATIRESRRLEDRMNILSDKIDRIDEIQKFRIKNSEK